MGSSKVEEGEPGLDVEFEELGGAGVLVGGEGRMISENIVNDDE